MFLSNNSLKILEKCLNRKFLTFAETRPDMGGPGKIPTPIGL